MLKVLSEGLAELGNSPYWAARNPWPWDEILDAADKYEAEEEIHPLFLGLIERGRDSVKNPWKYVIVTNQVDFYDSATEPIRIRFFDESVLLGKVGANTYLIWVGTTPQHPKIVALYTPGSTRGQGVTGVDLDALLATLQAPVDWEPNARHLDTNAD